MGRCAVGASAPCCPLLLHVPCSPLMHCPACCSSPCCKPLHHHRFGLGCPAWFCSPTPAPCSHLLHPHPYSHFHPHLCPYSHPNSIPSLFLSPFPSQSPSPSLFPFPTPSHPYYHPHPYSHPNPHPRLCLHPYSHSQPHPIPVSLLPSPAGNADPSSLHPPEQRSPAAHHPPGTALSPPCSVRRLECSVLP